MKKNEICEIVFLVFFFSCEFQQKIFKFKLKKKKKIVTEMVKIM